MPVRRLVPIAFATLASLALLLSPGDLELHAVAKEAPAPFVVHEWGTFTSMQGSDGIGLEGLHHAAIKSALGVMISAPVG